MKMDFFKKLKLPDKPGVYFFLGWLKRSKGGSGRRDTLYIGKATSLRDRVKSYFSKDLIETRGPLILDMTVKADNIKWQTTDSVLEALILESNLIKKHRPYYNTREKDDKSFNYVCITREKPPKVIIVRGSNLKSVQGSTLHRFGPYPNGNQLREAMKIIRRIFPYIDAQSAKRDNFEFYRQLGLTPNVGNKELLLQYKKNLVNLKLFFQGRKKKILKNLEKDMKNYAKLHLFEEAGEVKAQIFALKHINDIALLKLEPRTHQLEAGFRIEAYDVAHMGGGNMVGVMTVVEGNMPAKNDYRKFKIKTQSGANDVGALKEVLERRLAHGEWRTPNLMVLDGAMAQLNAAGKVLFDLGIKIPIVSVVKDARHKARAIMGSETLAQKHKSAILLANSEAHRFAIAYHKNARAKNFLK